MPPSPTNSGAPLSHHAWSTATVASARTSSQPQPQNQRSLQQRLPDASHQSQSRAEAQRFARQLDGKKDLKGGMTRRWLKEDAARDARREYRKALAVLDGKKRDCKGE